MTARTSAAAGDPAESPIGVLVLVALRKHPRRRGLPRGRRPDAHRRGASLDHVNNLGWTALIESIMLGDGGPRHTETVRALVEAGDVSGLW